MHQRGEISDTTRAARGERGGPRGDRAEAAQRTPARHGYIGGHKLMDGNRAARASYRLVGGDSKPSWTVSATWTKATAQLVSAPVSGQPLRNNTARGKNAGAWATAPVSGQLRRSLGTGNCAKVLRRFGGNCTARAQGHLHWGAGVWATAPGSGLCAAVARRQRRTIVGNCARG